MVYLVDVGREPVAWAALPDLTYRRVNRDELPAQPSQGRPWVVNDKYKTNNQKKEKADGPRHDASRFVHEPNGAGFTPGTRAPKEQGADGRQIQRDG